MSSSFNNIDLFGSGPHRFAQSTIGEYVLTNSRADPFQAGSTPIGPLNLVIIVRGRLVASSENDLWAVRDAIAALLTDPVTTASLKELSGRIWDDMSFATFTPDDRTDRGRVFSIAYTAVFIRL